ncbi:MAG: EamA family transporter RarD [Anaerolineales bacterium]|jgi:chloramphenicol-sensitive protein RarD
MNKGILYAIGAYIMWGLLPMYWKLLDHVSSFEILLHRVIWSFFLLAGIIFVRNRWERIREAVYNWRVLRVYLISATLIGLNWGLYVWAVNAGFIVETSLGYFINPLVSVLLGVIILGERLRPMKWIPIGLAAGGVVYLTISYGALPWIALSLAFTFGLYGLAKKTAPLESLYGLSLEMSILLLPALAALAYFVVEERAAFLHADLTSNLMLLGTGVVSTVPLLMFAIAARRIPLSQVGLLQYIAPTIAFFLGVFVYGESFSEEQMVGFSLVWLALILYWGEGWWVKRKGTTMTAAKPK